MKAVHVVKLHQPLEIRTDVEIPEPGPQEILVKITSTSLCSSDVAAQEGVSPTQLPFCAGHEPVGVVEKLGSGVVQFQIGDRVGFLPQIGPCCEPMLLEHDETGISAKKPRGSVGFSFEYGGFSEYSLASVPLTVKIPSGLDDAEAAPLLCAGVTAYGALKKVSRFQPGGSKISIIGCGGVGHLAIKYAKAMGYLVTAYDISDDKLQFALKCGADAALNSLTIDPGQLQKTTSCVVISASPKAYELAFRVVSPGGQIVAVGVPHGPISIDASCQGTVTELDEALSLAAEHGVKPEYELGNLDQINDDYRKIKEGRCLGRIVYRFGPSIGTSEQNS